MPNFPHTSSKEQCITVKALTPSLMSFLQLFWGPYPQETALSVTQFWPQSVKTAFTHMHRGTNLVCLTFHYEA